jgi:hypothetical protein
MFSGIPTAGKRLICVGASFRENGETKGVHWGVKVHLGKAAVGVLISRTMGVVGPQCDEDDWKFNHISRLLTIFGSVRKPCKPLDGVTITGVAAKDTSLSHRRAPSAFGSSWLVTMTAKNP